MPVRAASDLQEQDVKEVLQDVCADRRAIATFILIYRRNPGVNAFVRIRIEVDRSTWRRMLERRARTSGWFAASSG